MKKKQKIIPIDKANIMYIDRGQAEILILDKINETINIVNELGLKLDYLFYSKTNSKKAAEIMAQILGAKDESDQ